MKPIEERLKEKYNIQIKITDEGNGIKRISDSKGTVGHIADNNGQRRITYHGGKMYKHSLEAQGKDKKLKKREAEDAKERNREDGHFELYRIDDDGHYSPEDFIMEQIMRSFDRDNKEGKSVHHVYCVQVFTIERAYVDKDELKQMKKDNKMKMTYQDIRQFERSPNIPAIAPVIQQKLNELWKMPE